ncbi:MAG TPA: hypothetical protein DCE18_14605 [Syntrophobacteraceae bacterium]|nr:hypothetical protein [Syntrophobacteraceae bacterium]
MKNYNGLWEASIVILAVTALVIILARLAHYGAEQSMSHDQPASETQRGLRLASETQPGPQEPIPRIEDHVATVMCQEQEQQACPIGATWRTLRELGVEIECLEHRDRYMKRAKQGQPPVNWSENVAMMPCSKIVAIKLSIPIQIIHPIPIKEQ